MFLRKFKDVSIIVARNIFMLIHVIISIVIILLIVFGNTQEAVFLGIILLINIILGLSQELNAWAILERLSLLTALQSIRIKSDNTEETVSVEEINKGDLLRLKLGDQIPSDGTLVSTESFEVNEALITGESHSFAKKPGDSLLGGSIVTSGKAVMKVDVSYANSRIVQMTKNIKTYTENTSPAQKAANVFLRYTGILLIVSAIFIIVRGNSIHQPTVSIIENIGALASVLLPQGLVVAVTLLFAYGAEKLLKRNVLLQQINATEKLGRIKNLCMDKTGTLTESTLAVENVLLPPDSTLSLPGAKTIAAGYIDGSGDSSQTIRSLGLYLDEHYQGIILDSLSFSSDRQFGAVHLKEEGMIVLAGAPDILLPHLESQGERIWLQKILDENTHEGKRVFCMARANSGAIPTNLHDNNLSAICVFVLNNKLRPGIEEAIKFFQNRGVILRIISGDNPETVRAIAASAGVLNTEAAITGQELESWSDEDFRTKAKKITIFARIKPEQKEKIIKGLQHDGFTAMIGDGANDALAIKKADLGIAMFDSAPATRRIAAVVLVKNSFVDFPEGVALADRVIENAEIFSSIFFNQAFVGFFFFVGVMLMGPAYTYPFTPLSVAFMSWFIIAMPGFLISFWLLNASQNILPASVKPFLRRTVPFPLIASLAEAGTVLGIWIFSARFIAGTAPAMSAVVGFIGTSFIFFAITPMVYGGKNTRAQIFELFLLAIFEIGVFALFVAVHPVARFFDVTDVSRTSILEILPFVLICGLIEFFIAKRFVKRAKHGEWE